MYNVRTHACTSCIRLSYYYNIHDILFKQNIYDVRVREYATNAYAARACREREKKKRWGVPVSFMFGNGAHRVYTRENTTITKLACAPEMSCSYGSRWSGTVEAVRAESHRQVRGLIDFRHPLSSSHHLSARPPNHRSIFWRPSASRLTRTHTHAH